jgi:hypothetical protein
MQPSTGSRTQEPTRAKVKPGRALYILVTLLLAAVFSAAILPAFIPKASTFFEPAYLRVLYSLLSLAIALVTFGVLGDSDALVRSERDNGIIIQVAGSAAGFLLFFYLLSTGLSPYSNLTIYLYNSQGGLLTAADGDLEVTLAGKVRRSMSSSTGSVSFSYLPKAEDHRLLVSGSGWRVDDIKPHSCINDGRVATGTCSVVDVVLSRPKVCLSKVSLINFEAESIDTTLEVVLRRFVEGVQNAEPRANVKLVFSDHVLQERFHKANFTLHRKVEIERSVCTHLADIEGWFNSSTGRRTVRTALSCDTIYISLVEESVHKEAVECLEE